MKLPEDGQHEECLFEHASHKGLSLWERVQASGTGEAAGSAFTVYWRGDIGRQPQASNS